MKVLDYICKDCGQMSYRMPAKSPARWGDGHPACCGKTGVEQFYRRVHEVGTPPPGLGTVMGDHDAGLREIHQNNPMFAKF